MSNPKQRLVIATRQSALALWQAEFVAAELRRLHPGLDVSLLPMTTTGDQLLESPLSKVGGKGLFVKELERALLDGRADLAVHSMKDVPAVFPTGLGLSVIMQRANPHDALVSKHYNSLQDLPATAVVGTASLRRQSQLLAQFPQFKIKLLRGNVNTRLAKLDAGEFDAILLACAGLERLGFAERIREQISAETLLPAVGQGALGLETRTGDTAVAALLEPLNHQVTATCVAAERIVAARLGGSCQVPLAAYAEIANERLQLRALVAQPDGKKTIRDSISGPVAEATALAEQLANSLSEQGADQILAAIS